MTGSERRHDLVGIGEVMLRLAAPPPQRLEQTGSLDVQIGGAEANVAAACARLGLRTALISALPADNVWAERTVRELARHGVDAAGVLRRPDSRMGVYFLEYGAAPRPVRVLYDRRGSAFSRLVPEEVDWSLVRAARLLHVTGVTAALGDGPRAVVRRAVEEADGAGVPVSLDVNYRSRLWSPAAAREFLSEALPRASFVFVGADDAETVFGLAGPPDSVLAGLRALAPRATLALTLGEIGSAVLAGDTIHRPSKRYTVSVVDRVGAGDAYAAGFLWASLAGDGPQRATDVATALAALKCTMWGDVCLAGRAEVEELLARDSAEIRR